MDIDLVGGVEDDPAVEVVGVRNVDAGLILNSFLFEELLANILYVFVLDDIGVDIVLARFIRQTLRPPHQKYHYDYSLGLIWLVFLLSHYSPKLIT